MSRDASALCLLNWCVSKSRKVHLVGLRDGASTTRHLQIRIEPLRMTRSANTRWAFRYRVTCKGDLSQSNRYMCSVDCIFTVNVQSTFSQRYSQRYSQRCGNAGGASKSVFFTIKPKTNLIFWLLSLEAMELLAGVAFRQR